MTKHLFGDLSSRGRGGGLSVFVLSAVLGLLAFFTTLPAQAAVFNQPMNSSPIALSADQQFVWVVNPRDNSVSVIRTDTNTVLATLATGDEPRSVALDPNNTFAYVANAGDGTVTVIRIFSASLTNFITFTERTLVTGAEP